MSPFKPAFYGLRRIPVESCFVVFFENTIASPFDRLGAPLSRAKVSVDWPRLLVSWISGVLNDCELVESTVEGQVVGQTTWFVPQGCTGLSLNAYHCQADALEVATMPCLPTCLPTCLSVWYVLSPKQSPNLVRKQIVQDEMHHTETLFRQPFRNTTQFTMHSSTSYSYKPSSNLPPSFPQLQFLFCKDS